MTHQTLIVLDFGSQVTQLIARRVRELGVTGVPFFIFDNRVAVAGAQEPEALIEAIEEALAAPVDAA